MKIEVRGTAFAVEASQGRLMTVSVQSGKVMVRPRGSVDVLLGAGDHWQRQAPEKTEMPDSQDRSDRDRPTRAYRSSPGGKKSKVDESGDGSFGTAEQDGKERRRGVGARADDVK